MVEFLSNYGLWILLAGIFFAMHRFGMGCCGGGHQHAPRRSEDSQESEAAPKAQTATKSEAPEARRAGSCH